MDQPVEVARREAERQKCLIDVNTALDSAGQFFMMGVKGFLNEAITQRPDVAEVIRTLEQYLGSRSQRAYSVASFPGGKQQLVFVSEGFEAMTGFSYDDAIGRNCWCVLSAASSKDQ
jgi:hypothetical protein